MIPSHIAIIMDGNGRWANQQGLQRFRGHEAGVDAVKMVIEESLKLGVRYLTLYAFSIENMSRPAQERDFIARLFVSSVIANINELIEQGVKLNILGDMSAFPDHEQTQLMECLEKSPAHEKLTLNICYNYSGRWHIEQVARKLSAQDNINAQSLTKAFTADLGSDPDLLIRTGGECRISNFALWSLAYTEIYFSDVLWPDFSSNNFEQAIEWYKHRERRFGQVIENVKQRT